MVRNLIRFPPRLAFERQIYAQYTVLSSPQVGVNTAYILVFLSKRRFLYRRRGAGCAMGSAGFMVVSCPLAGTWGTTCGLGASCLSPSPPLFSSAAHPIDFGPSKARSRFLAIAFASCLKIAHQKILPDRVLRRWVAAVVPASRGCPTVCVCVSLLLSPLASTGSAATIACLY